MDYGIFIYLFRNNCIIVIVLYTHTHTQHTHTHTHTHTQIELYYFIRQTFTLKSYIMYIYIDLCYVILLLFFIFLHMENLMCVCINMRFIHTHTHICYLHMITVYNKIKYPLMHLVSWTHFVYDTECINWCFISLLSVIICRYEYRYWWCIMITARGRCATAISRGHREFICSVALSPQLCAHESHLRRSVSPSWGWRHDSADVLQHLAWSAQGCSCACHSSSTWGKIRQHHVTKTHLWGSESAKRFWSLSIRSWDLMRKWERTLKRF